jgi:hypothetical protein
MTRPLSDAAALQPELTLHINPLFTPKYAAQILHLCSQTSLYVPSGFRLVRSVRTRTDVCQEGMYLSKVLMKANKACQHECD